MWITLDGRDSKPQRRILSEMTENPDLTEPLNVTEMLIGRFLAKSNSGPKLKNATAEIGVTGSE